jgi:hypothetical protein
MPDTNAVQGFLKFRKRRLLPEGRTPFFLGDNVEHGASEGPRDSLRDALTWAASLGRQRPEVELHIGEPEVVSRTPAAPERPVVRASGEVHARRSVGGVRPEPRREVPPALQSVFAVDPDVGQYMATLEDDELERAQGQSRDLTLAARLAHAGAMGNTALSGARHEEGAYQDLEDGARQPVADLLERRKSAMARNASARDAEAAAYQRAQDRERLALERERLAQQERIHADDRAARSADHALQREDMAMRWKLAQGGKQSAADDKRQDMLGRQNEKDLAELAKRAQPGTQMKDDLETVNGFISSGELPGVGIINGRLPEFLISKDGTRLRQAASRLVQNLIYAKSGKAITEQEAQRVMEGNGMGPNQSDKAFIQGMQALAREAQASMRNIEAGFSPEVVEMRHERGGTTAADLPGPAPTRTGRYKRGKDGRVWAELSDGSAEEVR